MDAPRALVMAVVVAFGTAATARAAERLVRRTDAVGHVTALAESAAGELWMGTHAGLHHHDGHDWQVVARETIRGLVTAIVVIDGGLIATEEFGPVWLVPSDGGAPIALVDPAGRALRGPVGVASAGGGEVWAVDAHGVYLGPPRALARVAVPDALVAEIARLITGAPGGGAYLATRRGLWRVARDGTTARLVDITPPAQLLVEGADVLLLAWDGTLSRWRDGTLARLFAPELAQTRPRRGISLARRGDTLWVSYDLMLVALRADRPPVIVTGEHDLPSGGPLLVDREGSLWLGTFRGLRQLPEPDTVAFAERDGLPSSHGRFAAVTDEGAWLTTWQGAGLLRHGADRVEPADPPGATMREPMCLDGAGRLWTGAGRRLFVRERGESRLIDQGDLDFQDCVVDGGAVWMGTDAGVFVVDPSMAMPELVALPPIDRAGRRRAEQVAIDRAGRLWITQRDRVCHAPRAGAGVERAWTCTELAGATLVADLWATPSGSVWLAARPGGLYRVAGDRLEKIPGGDRLPTEVVLSLAPSPRGGVWIAAAGATWRVAEAPADADGWRVLERLGPWQGLVTGSVTHVAEDAGGDLWLASSAGLIAVPAAARPGPHRPPAVAIAEVRAGGRPIAAAPRIGLRSGANALELRFTARSRRAPELVSYRVRVGGGPWSAPRATAELQLVDVPSGSRTVEVAASLDGERWGEPARLAVEVPTPWHRRPLVWGAAAALLAAALYALHRARLAVHLRLERQRLRIAMDLHDELGSGLGSIGVLAGVASTDDDAASQREVAATIATTAADLGASLGDLVWSLRRGACTLDELGRRLAARARATFAAGDVELALALDLPAIALSPATARAVQLVGQEALHNAGRHARARRVAVDLRRELDRRWRLSIEDDGVGLPDGADERGLGLTSMRRRARAIGASFTLGPGAGGRGTRLELVFRPDADDGRVAVRRLA